MDGPSWAQLEHAARTTPEKIRLKLMRGVTSYDEFADLVETALNYSIGEMIKEKNIINPAGKLKNRLDEDQCTLMLTKPLKGMTFDVSHSKNVGGNCDISVEGDSEMLWLGEAKIYSDYGKLMGGFQQLCDRYSSGMPNQTRGALIIYFFDGQIGNVMENWRKYVGEARDQLIANDVVENPLQFQTSEPHGATGIPLNVRHMPVPLMHEPTDVAAPPKRNAA